MIPIVYNNIRNNETTTINQSTHEYKLTKDSTINNPELMFRWLTINK